ncbi:MAG: BamA/TamA family outer membrane protein [Gemmatimonadota bacterium]
MTRRSVRVPGQALALALLLLVPAARPAAGQDRAVPAAERCELGVVTHIFIDNHSIFDTSDPELDPAFQWAYSLANKLHRRTRKEVIERELLFEVGDCYDPLLLEDSERLLRAHDFIGRVDAYGIQQPEGGYHVVVDTEDEWSTQVDVKFDLSGQFEFEEFDIREQNLLGTGRSLGFFYRAIEANRSYGLLYESPQLLRTRWDLEVAAGQTRAGTLLHQEVRYPFLGEAGRWAFREWFQRQDRLFDYILPPDLGVEDCGPGHPNCRILVPVRRKGFHVAGLRRFGQRGNLTVLGAGFSFQELSYPGGDDAVSLVVGGDYQGRVPAPAPLRGRALDLTQSLRNIRAVVLAGKRNIQWQQRRGLDSFHGDEDVRVGAEVELAFARSIPGLETDNDLYGSMDLYAAAGPPSLFFGTRLRADVRRDYSTEPDEYEMQDVLGEGEAFVYLQPSFLPRHTLVLRAAGAAGWHMETPFQLTLGGERALRGWPEEGLPGGRRVVLTAEDRFYLGWPFPDVADFGTSLFADVGRVWPGEAPYGTDSGWRAAVGFGIRANFPARGTNTFRVDAAFPVGPDGGIGRLQLLIGVGEYLGITAPFSDPQLDRSRIPPVTGNLLHFPN